jgi:AcrR family transcriptional regulator
VRPPQSSNRRPLKLKPGPGQPRSFVARNQRERLLAAVAEASLQIGYQAATIDEIARHAGVSKKTFYVHFKNKDEIFLAAYQETLERLTSTVNRAFLADGDWATRIAAALQAFLGFLTADPAFAQLCIVEVHAAGRQALERRNNALELFAEYFELGRAEAPPDAKIPPLTAQTIVGGIHEVIYRHILDGQLNELPNLHAELVFNAILPYLGLERASAEYQRLKP